MCGINIRMAPLPSIPGLIVLCLISLAGSLLFCPPVRAQLEAIQFGQPEVRVVNREFSGTGRETSAWIINAGQLYMKPDQASAVKNLLSILEKNLGIQSDGSLDFVAAWQSQKDLAVAFDKPSEEFSGPQDTWRYYLRDKLSLVGFNYLYFEICVINQEQNRDRFLRYYEKGFYPNQNLFTKNAHYYRSLYFYLYLVTADISQKFNRAAVFLNDNPGRDPIFIAEEDIRRFQLAVWTAAELDLFISQRLDIAEALYEKVFSEEEQSWLKDSIGYFLGPGTHAALLSYPWFRRNLPLEASADMVSHEILKTWKEQAVIIRSRLPLMFFGDKGSTLVSIENVFDASLEKLRLDNRKVDIMVLTALGSWLTKQVEQGIRMEDRKKFNRILAELRVCPTGWVFANLYDCRTYLAELKAAADEWEKEEKKVDAFNTRVMDAFFGAREKIDRIFIDLEKIYGQEQKAGRINYIFNRYRGEINYYFKYIQFETFGGNSGVVPAAGPEGNYMNDFKVALASFPQSRQNHINLLKGYHLLLRKLYAGGRIDDIQQLHKELESLINGPLKLGSSLDHQENDLYDIYRVLTYAYLSSDILAARSLETAQKGFALAREYYVQAAEKAGFSVAGSIGAITRDNTEMDDYQRQFELYRHVAGRLGKRIQLLVPETDVQLYNRIQDMRQQGNFM